jgi:hypothetical protein
MPFESLTLLKQRLGITATTDNDLLLQLQASAEDWLCEICSRDFVPETYTESFPLQRGSIILRNRPMASIDNVEVQANSNSGFASLDSNSYWVDLELGLVQSKLGRWVPENGNWLNSGGAVRVTYTVTAEVPEAILQAVAELVGHWYRAIKTDQATRQQNISQQKIADTFTIFSSMSERIPASVANLIAPFRNLGV